MPSWKQYDVGKNHQFLQILAIFIGSLTGISDGLLFAWTSPSIPAIVADKSLGISLEEASYFTTISAASLMITAPFFSILVDWIGRKKGVLLIAVPQFSAWLLTIFANNNVWIFYAARFMAGMGDAIFFATIPIYVCEIAEPSVRGTWGNALAVSIYVGIFSINVIGAHCSIINTGIICATLPIITVTLFMFMPESPFFLLMKGREAEAKKALQALRWRTDVEEELSTLKTDMKRQTSERGTMKELFTVSSNRRALIMCMGIRIAQQLSGLSAFEMYTQYLFQMAGGSVSQEVSAIIFAGILTLVVILASYLVEKFGRKPLMSFSCLGCGIVLTIETIYFVLGQFTTLNMQHLGWLPLTGMIAYIVICATGIGILPTLILGEIFSASIKGKAGAVMNVVTGACLLVVPKLFLTLTYNFGIYSPFAFFSVCCYLGVLFSHFCIIETKGKTLEQIQQDLKGNKEKKANNNECDLFLMKTLEKV